MVQAASKWDTERKGVTFFLTEKMNLEIAESGGKTALALAATTNLYEVVKMLVSVCLLNKEFKDFEIIFNCFIRYHSLLLSQKLKCAFSPLYVVDIALL